MRTCLPPTLVTQLYDCNRTVEFKTTAVSFDELRQYHGLLKKLRQGLGEDATNDFWRPVIGELKGFWYDISANPLSDARLKARARQAHQAAESRLRYIELAYTDWVPLMREITERLATLQTTKLDRLLHATTQQLQQWQPAKVAIAIAWSRMIPAVEEALGHVLGHRRFSVITPAAMRAGAYYDAMAVVGPPQWFAPFVFTAPRAPKVQLIRFAWLRGAPARQAAFDAPLRHAGNGLPAMAAVDAGIEEDDPDLGEETPIEWAFTRFGGSDAGPGETAETDSVEARALVLENDEIVFLEADGASALVIDPDEDAANRVRRVDVAQLEPGMFLLLRTGGGGDYIVPLADRILGKQATSARELQRDWKQLLRRAVRAKGLSRIAVEIAHSGSSVASPVNVMHWMAERSIKTKKRRDFDAILSVIGLREQADRYWETMRLIDTAHKRAGVLIRQMLLKQVNQRDLSELTRLGVMVFELTDHDSGSLTALRVKSVSAQTRAVPVGKLGELLRSE